MRGTFTENYVF